MACWSRSEIVSTMAVAGVMICTSLLEAATRRVVGPYYAPHQELTPADIVNLGFVINVIEDYDERAEALRAAFALAGTRCWLFR